MHPPFLLGGLNLLPNFQKGEAWQVLNFEREVAGKEGGNVFQGGGKVAILQKKQLKSEIFNDKKSL